jgi:hypothetical protein
VLCHQKEYLVLEYVFLGLILWGGWNVYQGRRKSFNEANAANNNLVSQCMKQLPPGSSVCDLHYNTLVIMILATFL